MADMNKLEIKFVCREPKDKTEFDVSAAVKRLQKMHLERLKNEWGLI